MRTLIIPCAGQSTRYLTDIPKYLLTHPSGKMMLYESIQGLPMDDFDSIKIVVLKKHLTNVILSNIYLEFDEYKNVDVLILNNPTSSASETVSKCIKSYGITGGIHIKDVDDYFEINEIKPNQVATISLDNVKNITPSNKSYVRSHNSGEILSIIEKKVISSDFCSGLHSFSSADEFVKTYEELEQIDGEIYISHVIYKMLLNGKRFTINEAQNFIDWGTQCDWDLFIKNYNK